MYFLTLLASVHHWLYYVRISFDLISLMLTNLHKLQHQKLGESRAAAWRMANVDLHNLR